MKEMPSDKRLDHEVVRSTCKFIYVYMGVYMCVSRPAMAKKRTRRSKIGEYTLYYMILVRSAKMPESKRKQAQTKTTIKCYATHKSRTIVVVFLSCSFHFISVVHMHKLNIYSTKYLQVENCEFSPLPH